MPTPSSHCGTTLTTSARLEAAPDDNIKPSDMPIPILTIYILLRHVGGEALGTTAALYAWILEIGLENIHDFSLLHYEDLCIFKSPARENMRHVVGVDSVSGIPNYYDRTLELLKVFSYDFAWEKASDKYSTLYGINIYKHLEVLHEIVKELNFRGHLTIKEYNRGHLTIKEYNLPEYNALQSTPLIVLEEFCDGNYE